MTLLLAAAGAACAVLAAWNLLGALADARPALAALLAPLRLLGRTGTEPSRAERQRLALVAAATLAACGWLLWGTAGATLLGLAGPALAAGAVRERRRRHADARERGAPAAARALADALAAGHSVRGALAEAARGTRGPAGAHLRRCAHALALGEPTADALERLAQGGRTWAALAAALSLGAGAGSDLPALLGAMAASGEEALAADADARAATAQARFTALVVVLLPAGAAVLAEVAAPGSLAALLASPASLALATAGLALALAGALMVRRLARPA